MVLEPSGTPSICSSTHSERKSSVSPNSDPHYLWGDSPQKVGCWKEGLSETPGLSGCEDPEPAGLSPVRGAEQGLRKCLLNEYWATLLGIHQIWGRAPTGNCPYTFCPFHGWLFCTQMAWVQIPALPRTHCGNTWASN